MVPEPLLKRRAAELGLGLAAIVREQAVLASLDILRSLEHTWILRGGTALAYGYFDVHRLSEDLDLTSPGEPGETDALVGELCNGLSVTLGQQVMWTEPVQPLLAPGLRRVDLIWGDTNRLQIDFSWHEPTIDEPHSRSIEMPYPGYGSFDIPMWSLPELMANKWFILDGRAEPRDLFDLWFGLTQFHVEWAELVRAHRDRYGFPPVLANIRRRGLRERWESRLGPQIRDLPPFDEVERELRWHVEFEQE